ncbi:methyltransferase family protein [Methyloglobulus sp.]|uniref:methyltransferase family protein n=1 Tax=Methyloglobulus sp. TaxID=2518622 RepID=UPI003989BCD2
MVQIGNFFFKYRNWVFIPLYLALFIPSPLLAPEHRHRLLLLGLGITIAGQALRGATIGLAYIERGGRNKQVYASRLVTEGLFNHCRNPLYVGNILMLLGVGILANSWLYLLLFIPAFLFIYQSIVLAEEHFLRGKFGAEFDGYCQRIHRWLPILRGLRETFSGMQFNWRRYLLKELTTLYVWLLGIVLLLFYKYPELTGYDTALRNRLLFIIIPLLTLAYLSVRYLKKSGKMRG